MRPLRATSLEAITAAARRHYLRPVSLTPDPARSDRWTVSVEGKQARTEIVKNGDRYTFQEIPKP